MISFSITLSFWAWRVFGLSRIFGLKIDRIIDYGPYKYMRHPQYFSLTLGVLGLVLLFNTVYMLVFAVSTIVVFYFIALFEERKLLTLFGKNYEMYRRRTPFFPIYPMRRKNS